MSLDGVSVREKLNNKYNSGRDNNRQELWKVVPRSVPFAIGITPTDLCNFRCIYCNQSTEAGIADAKTLSWQEVLVQLGQIEDLLRGEKEDLKIIAIHGNGEPLIHPQIADIVHEISARNLAPRIEITTNGSLLTHSLSDDLISAGLTKIIISIQGTTSEKYKEICNYSIEIEKLIDELNYFHTKSDGKCRVHIKTLDIALNGDEDRERFLNMFSPVCDDIYIEHVMDACGDVDYSQMIKDQDSSNTRFATDVIPMKCCNTLFMYLNIHSNGDADCCGCKYPPRYIGNIYKTPMKDLWNGDVHRELMKMHLEGRRNEIKLCSNCASIEQYNGFKEDVLDDHLEEILHRMQKLSK